MAKSPLKPATKKGDKSPKTGNGGKPKGKSSIGSEPCVLTIPEWTGSVFVQGMGSVTITVPAREVILPECACSSSSPPCCEPCDQIPTGKWGIPWRDAAGNWQCLQHPGGEKELHGSDDEPFWSNL